LLVLRPGFGYHARPCAGWSRPLQASMLKEIQQIQSDMENGHE
jgi:hypothetical protein